MIRALLCSGQGRLERSMLDLFAGTEAAAPILAAAKELLGRDPLELLADADDDALLANRTSQLLCVARALAAAAALDFDEPALVAGYSVGEMAAWSVAGFWQADQALRLTAQRAELMDKADSDGALGFIRGLGPVAVDRLVAAHGCAVAIRNPDRLFIIGGARDAIAPCCEAALAAGATSARPIPVRVASHTPRLAGAVAPFEQVLLSKGMGSPTLGRSLISATDAAIVASAETGLPGLARQLETTIDWDAVLHAIAERGAGRILELGPGTALAEMARPAFPDIEIRAVDDFRTIAGARQWFARS